MDPISYLWPGLTSIGLTLCNDMLEMLNRLSYVMKQDYSFENKGFILVPSVVGSTGRENIVLTKVIIKTLNCDHLKYMEIELDSKHKQSDFSETLLLFFQILHLEASTHSVFLQN